MEKIKNKLRRLKASNTVMKFFKSSTNGNVRHFTGISDGDILNIRHTKDTQSFRKPSLTNNIDKKEIAGSTIKSTTNDSYKGPIPMPGNETIIEGNLTYNEWTR